MVLLGGTAYGVARFLSSLSFERPARTLILQAGLTLALSLGGSAQASGAIGNGHAEREGALAFLQAEAVSQAVADLVGVFADQRGVLGRKQ